MPCSPFCVRPAPAIALHPPKPSPPPSSPTTTSGATSRSTEAIQRSIPEDTHVVWDVTQFGYYARRTTQPPQAFIDSGYGFEPPWA